MAIRLRLAYNGLRNNRIFHLVAIDHRKARDAKPAELLGVYKPRIEGTEGNKTLEWSVSRIKYWLEKGAMPSKSVLGLLEQGGILELGSPYSQAGNPCQSVTLKSAKPVPAGHRRKLTPETRDRPRMNTAPQVKPSPQ